MSPHPRGVSGASRAGARAQPGPADQASRASQGRSQRSPASAREAVGEDHQPSFARVTRARARSRRPPWRSDARTVPMSSASMASATSSRSVSGRGGEEETAALGVAARQLDAEALGEGLEHSGQRQRGVGVAADAAERADDRQDRLAVDTGGVEGLRVAPSVLRREEAGEISARRPASGASSAMERASAPSSTRRKRGLFGAGTRRRGRPGGSNGAHDPMRIDRPAPPSGADPGMGARPCVRERP